MPQGHSLLEAFHLTDIETETQARRDVTKEAQTGSFPEGGFICSLDQKSQYATCMSPCCPRRGSSASCLDGKSDTLFLLADSPIPTAFHSLIARPLKGVCAKLARAEGPTLAAAAVELGQVAFPSLGISAFSFEK